MYVTETDGSFPHQFGTISNKSLNHQAIGVSHSNTWRDRQLINIDIMAMTSLLGRSYLCVAQLAVLILCARATLIPHPTVGGGQGKGEGDDSNRTFLQGRIP